MTLHAESITTDDGVRLFAEVAGTGGDAVIIPNRVFMTDPFATLAARRTVVFADPRNRGRSETITDDAKLARGVLQDVDDFEAIRRHFGFDRVSLLGHSYMATVVVLYAMKYPERAKRIVQIGATGPEYTRRYPADLMNQDATFTEVLTEIGELQKRRATFAAQDFCREFWKILRPLYVVNRADADRLAWAPCDLPNEMAFMKQFIEHVIPSLERLQLSDADFARVEAPVLVVHGRLDRSSPYGAGRDWAMHLPNARLLTVDRAAHVPWIEAPALTLNAIETFLDGSWPDAAERIAV